MADVVLHAEKREARGSRPAGRLRREGQVPAVVYGLGTDTVPVEVPARDLNHILTGGANTLITLELDGDQALTLVRQVQRHATRGELLHVDFIRIRRDVAVAAEVPLHLEGEPVGVRDGGLLEQLIFQLAIEAKPEAIPHAITWDVSALEIGSQLHLSEIQLPDGVTATIDPETLVAQIAAPRVQETAGEGAEGTETPTAAESAPTDAADSGE